MYNQPQRHAHHTKSFLGTRILLNKFTTLKLFFFNKKDWWTGETEFTEVMELSDEVIKFVHALQIENLKKNTK